MIDYDRIFIGGLFAGLICGYLYSDYKDSKAEKQFINNLCNGTSIKLEYYDDKGNVEYEFKAKIKSLDWTRNIAIIKYSDGSESREYIKGFNSLYQIGWRLDKNI